MCFCFRWKLYKILFLISGMNMSGHLVLQVRILLQHSIVLWYPIDQVFHRYVKNFVQALSDVQCESKK